MGGPSQTTQQSGTTAQNSASNTASQTTYGVNSGSTYGANSGQNSVQTYDPSALGQSYLAAGTAPASSGISNYLNPYQQQVINSTMAQLGQQFGQQQSQVLGNAISNNALGGDRQAVAQSALAGQQGLAAGSTLAGLNSQNYSQALQAAQSDATRNLQAAGMAGGTNAGQSLSSTLGGQQSSVLGGQNTAQSTAASGTGAYQGTGTTTTDPGLMGYVGAGLSALGMFSGAKKADGGAIRLADGGSTDALMKMLQQSIGSGLRPLQQAGQNPGNMYQLGEKARGGLSNILDTTFGSSSTPTVSDGGWSTGTQTSGLFGSGGLGFAAGGNTSISAPNVSAPTLGSPNISAPNVRVPQFAQPATTSGKGSNAGSLFGGLLGSTGASAQPQTQTQTQDGYPGVYAPSPTVPQAHVANGGAIHRDDGGEVADPFADAAVNPNASTASVLPQETQAWGPNTPGGKLWDWMGHPDIGQNSDYGKLANNVLHGLLSKSSDKPQQSNADALATPGLAGLTGSLSKDLTQPGLSPALASGVPMAPQPSNGGFSTQTISPTAQEPEVQLPADQPSTAQPTIQQGDSNLIKDSSPFGPDADPLPGKKGVVQTMVQGFRAAGMSDNAIRGIMANVKDESGFDPTLRHPDQPKWGGEAHYAHGLFQEGGAEWNHFNGWMQENHPHEDWRNPKLQTEFLAENLKTNYPQVWKAMNNGTPEQAAQVFVNGYLKPRADFAASRTAQYGRGVPEIDDFLHGVEGGIKQGISAIGSGVQSAGEGVSGGLSSLAQGIKSTVARGFDNSGQQPQHGFLSPQDQASGGLISRIFGVNFNPLNLTSQERTGLVRMGAAMMQTGNLGAGLNAYQNSLENGQHSALQTKMDTLRLIKMQQEIDAGLKPQYEKVKNASGGEDLITVDRQGNAKRVEIPGRQAAATQGGIESIPAAVVGGDFVSQAQKLGVPAQDLAEAQRIAQYDTDINKLYSIKSDRRAYIDGLASRINPDYRPENYKAAADSTVKLAGGDTAKALRSIGRLFDETEQAAGLVDSTHNSKYETMNQASGLVYPSGSEYQQAQGKLGTALNNVFDTASAVAKGGGQGAEGDAKRRADTMNRFQAPETLKGALYTEAEIGLKNGQSNLSSYNTAHGYTPDNPKYRTIMDYMTPAQQKKAVAMLGADKIEEITGRPAPASLAGRGAASRTQAATGQTAAPSSTPNSVSSKQQYDALPSGSQYIDARDGKLKVKS